MLFDNALKILRCECHNSDADIEQAYQKMVKRYPPEFFPEKFIEIRKAYNLLIANDDFWKELLESEHLDLSFLYSSAQRSQDEKHY
ncbi:MAG: hypothetical protein HQK52_00860 [Oligoflexia bacterium]|nr:hypothetical protein [Oligoflexia bacterium]